MSGLMGSTMQPYVFELLLLLIAMYSVHTFPVETEVVNKVYHELRDIVKLASKTADNVTQTQTAIDPVDIVDVNNVNTTGQDKEHLIQQKINNNSETNGSASVTNVSSGAASKRSFSSSVTPLKLTASSFLIKKTDAGTMGSLGDFVPMKTWKRKKVSQEKRKNYNASIRADGELTNEIEDVTQVPGNGHVRGHHGNSKSEGSRRRSFKPGLRETISRSQSPCNESGDEHFADTPNNQMYHEEHGHRYIKHQSGNMHHRHHGGNDDHDDDHDEEHEDGGEWHNYRHKKFHHVKFKFHGVGKTPSEWAKQEAKELEDQKVIFHHGAYHVVDHDPESKDN